MYLVVLTVKVESRIILIIIRVKVKSKMASPYHFIGQNPHKYEYSDGTKRISSLSVEEIVYPDDVVIDETEVGALRPRRGGDRVNYRQLAGYRE